ncbi:hypothetical protein ACN20G_31815 (plasmid) [Streptomyces sp. BI20]|uniref:hypothetical protein n=1 Tax=Streptomyces sp. BI20 TaxID=3403460 RepID=UPI003C70E61E
MTTPHLPLPSCPVCGTPATRVLWRDRGSGPISVTVEPCGHAASTDEPPRLVLDPVVVEPLARYAV